MFVARNTLLIPPVAAVTGLTFKAAAYGGNPGTIPAHNVGDLIVLFVERGSNSLAVKPAAAGTVPAWVDIDAATGANTISGRTAYFVATATNHTTGTWTSAGPIIACVLSGQNASPIGGHATATAASGTPTAPSITMTKTDGTSKLLEFYGVGAATGSTWSAAPAGYTQRAAGVTSANGSCLNTKDVTTSDGSIAQTQSAGAQYFATQIEILAA